MEDRRKIKFEVKGCDAKAYDKVDLYLQIGQMTDSVPEVFWLMEGGKIESVKSDYLSKRPGLKDFVEIDDDWSGREIRIKDEAIFQPEEAPYAYLHFEDEILYYGEGATLMESTIISSEEELRRMAFNTHVIWAGEGNIDYENVKRDFEKPYNYNSSSAFVESIPYKMRSIGIVEDDPETVAAMLKQRLDKAKEDINSESGQFRTQLAELEHRRWIIEKSTKGFVGPHRYISILNNNGDNNADMENDPLKRIRTLFEECAEQNTRIIDVEDVVPKMHPSVVPWHELDCISSEMHKAMRNASKKLKQNPEELAHLLNELEILCKQDNQDNIDDIEGPTVINNLIRDYDRYRLCISKIMDNNKPYAEQFETYQKILKESIEARYKKEAQRVYPNELIESIESVLYTTIEACVNRDYKQNNYDLIDNLPYILTAKNDIRICMSLGSVNNHSVSNDQFFKNVASATALNAISLTFLMITDSHTQLDIMKLKLKAINRYFKIRGSKCTIDLIVFDSLGNASSGWSKQLKKALNETKKNGYIQTKKIINYETIEELGELIKMEIIENIKPDYYDGTIGLTSSNIDNMILTPQVVETVPYFEFDSEQKQFHNCKSCCYLSYHEPSSFIQIEDMFALMCAQDKSFNYPNYADTYLNYWKILSGELISETDFPLCAFCWNKICGILNKAGKTNNYEIKEERITIKNENQARILKKMLKQLEKYGDLSELTIKRSTIQTIVDSETKDEAVLLVSSKVNNRIQELVHSGGNLLEYYVYFEACKKGWFDDVQTGYNFKWENEETSNEIDCILTKGYRSIIVECKSVRDSDAAFYYKLDSLAEHFGIGYRKVIIMITNVDCREYDRNATRGKQMDIVTISTKEDLDRIGEKLVEVMK